MKHQFTLLTAALAALAATTMACSDNTNEKAAQSTDTVATTTAPAEPAEPEQIAEPNYPLAMGFSRPVKLIVGESTDPNYEMEYHAFTFDEKGHLTQYETGETVESAYTFTTFFGEDGLPTRSESVFINYWDENVVGDDYPVTTTPFKITKETADSVTTIHIEGGDEGRRLLAKVTRDKHNRIVQVMNQEKKKTFTYTYDEQNIPRYKDGSVAVPQIDMAGGPAIKCPATIKPGALKMKAGTWSYDITYHGK